MLCQLCLPIYESKFCILYERVADAHPRCVVCWAATCRVSACWTAGDGEVGLSDVTEFNFGTNMNSPKVDIHIISIINNQYHVSILYHIIRAIAKPMVYTCHCTLLRSTGTLVHIHTTFDYPQSEMLQYRQYTASKILHQDNIKLFLSHINGFGKKQHQTYRGPERRWMDLRKSCGTIPIRPHTS